MRSIFPKSPLRVMTNLILFSLCISMVVYTAELMSEPKVAAIYGSGLDFRNFPTLAERLLRVRRSYSSSPAEVIEDTKRLLAAGEENIILQDDLKDIIMVMGTTGTGKTTLTQILSGDNSQLFAYKVRGSGFLIRDTQERISNETVVSKSIFPELVIDSETKSALYDCPGFKDTRNVSVEIANTYFLKKLTDHAEKIKILLIVNHESLRPGRIRTGLKDLVNHMLMFLKDVPHYNRSMAMIASKVDFCDEPDEEIVQGIAEFLENAKEEFKQTDSSHRLPEIHDFIDSFLVQDTSGRYSNIGFFCQPRQEGPLSENPVVQDNRIKLRDLTFHNDYFTYQSSRPSDFGYALSDKAQVVVRDLLSRNFEDAEIYLTAFGKNLSELYVEKMLGILKFQELLNIAVDDEQEAFSTLTTLQANHNRSIQAVVTDILNFTHALKLLVPSEKLKELRVFLNHIKFFEQVTEKSIDHSQAEKLTKELVKAFGRLAATIKSYATWFTQIQNMMDNFILSPPDHKLLDSIRNLNLTTTTGKPSSSRILTSDDLATLVFPNSTLRILQSFLFPGEEKKLELLEQFLLVAAGSEPKCSYVSATKTVKVSANFVRASQALACVARYATPIKSLAILASSVIIMDVDIDGRELVESDGLNLILLGPKLRVLGTQTINLDGKPGSLFPGPADTDVPGSKGRPGGNGGQFFGSFLENEGFLTIQANGGQGGAGQDGGTGKDGTNGTSVTLSDIIQTADMKVTIFSSAYYNRSGCCESSLIGCTCTVLNIYGERGSNGDHGQRGGVGGIGGSPGIVQFKFPTQNYGLRTILASGTEGPPGKPGKGGKGGANGSGIQVKYYHSANKADAYAFVGALVGGPGGAAAGASIGATIGNPRLQLVRNITATGFGDNGDDGSEIANDYKSQRTHPVVTPITPQFNGILNAFKAEVRLQLHNGLLQPALSEYLSKLESDPEIRSGYNIRGIINDFYNLEQQYFDIKDYVNISPYYESIATRLAEVASRDNETLDDVGRRLLSSAQTAVLQKRLLMFQSQQPRIIVSLEKDLKHAISDISTGVTSNSQNDRDACALYRTSDAYFETSECRNVTHDILKLNLFIKTEVDEEFANLKDMIKNETKAFSKEFTYSNSTLDKLERLIVANHLLKTLHLARDFVTFLGPASAFSQFVATITSKNYVPRGGSSILEDVLFKNPWEHIQTHIVENTLKLNETHRKVHNDLTKIHSNPYPDQFLSFKTKISQKYLNQSKQFLEFPNSTFSPSFPTLETIEFNRKLRDFHAEIETAYHDIYVKSPGFRTMCWDRFNPVSLPHTESIPESIRVSLGITCEIEVIRTKLESAVQNCMEDMILQLGPPHLKNWLSPRGRNGDEIKFRFISSLNDIRYKVKSLLFLPAPHIHQHFTHVVHKVDVALTSFVEMYDDIRRFVIESYLTKLNTEDGSDVPKKYAQSAKELDSIVRASKILTHSKIMTQPFAMWMFPFAHHYSGHFIHYSKVLPTLGLTNTEQVAEKIYLMLQDMLDIIRRYKSGSDEVDKYIFHAEFKDQYAFASWDTKDYFLDIQHLLEGKPVVLKADVTKSPLGREAIKFQTLQLRILSTNNTLQGQLDKRLEYFNANLAYLGSGHHRYGNKYWKFDSPRYHLVHSFSKDADGESEERNAVYKKISQGDPILTPYGLWEVQIMSRNASDIRPYERLEEFKNSSFLQLQLVGQGTFVQSGLNYTFLRLNEYYQEDTSMSV